MPLSFRAGKQQIVWGETDNFRMLDRANPLDLTWHFQQEIPAPAFGWDEIRRPLWMFKFLYDIGNVVRSSPDFLEWYWNPGDWCPAKQAFLPRPWGLRFLNPLTTRSTAPSRRAFCVGDRGCGRFASPSGSTQRRARSLMNGTQLFKQGDYERNPIDNSQVGVRLHVDRAVRARVHARLLLPALGRRRRHELRAPARPPRTTTRTQRTSSAGPARHLPGRGVSSPYVHTIGVSANYSDEECTQAVFRFETIYDVGIPFFDVARETVIDTPALPGITQEEHVEGHDRVRPPTWIRWLNKKSTFFLTGQFFWHYLVNNPECQPQRPVAQLTFGSREDGRVGSCLVGGLDLPSSKRLGTIDAAEAGSPAFRDKIRDWEALFTFAAFSFYRGGSIVPVLGIAVDPVNQWNMEPFWTVDYVVRNDFVVNIGAALLRARPRGHNNPIFETWGLAGSERGPLRDVDPAHLPVLDATRPASRRATRVPRPGRPPRAVHAPSIRAATWFESQEGPG